MLNSTRAEIITSSPKSSVGAGRLTPLTSMPVTGKTTSTLTASSTINVPTSVKHSVTTKSQILVSLVPTASKPSVSKRNTFGGDKRHIFQEYEEEAAWGIKTAAMNKGLYSRDILLMSRQPELAVRALDTTNNDDEGSIVIMSYFGVCASNTTTDWGCTKKRHQAGTIEGSPPKFLDLGRSLQGAISPVPPIIAVTLQGALMLFSLAFGFKSSTNLRTRLEKTFVILAFATFCASFFTAILFQSAAGMIYSAFTTSETIVVSKGSSGIALAWAGVFFTSLAMAGAIAIVLLADVPQNAKNNAKTSSMSNFFNRGARQERDIEVPPAHHSSLRCKNLTPASGEGRELHPQRGNLRPEAQDRDRGVYLERVDNMRRGNSSFGNGWNMI